MVKKKFEKLDNIILHFCSSKIRNKFFDRLMPAITHSNDFGFIYLGLILIAVISKYKITDAVCVFLAIVFGLVAGEGIIKHVVRRRRPQSQNPIDRLLVKLPKTFSFPSGHTTSSFAALGVLWGLNSGLIYVFLIAAILISFSRLYLNLHYPSDVMGGIALGLLCSKAVILLQSSGTLVHSMVRLVDQIHNYK